MSTSRDLLSDAETWAKENTQASYTHEKAVSAYKAGWQKCAEVKDAECKAQLEAMKDEIERLKRGEHWTEQEIEMAKAKAQQMRLTLFSDVVVKEELQAKDAEIERLKHEYTMQSNSGIIADKDSWKEVAELYKTSTVSLEKELAELKQKLGVAREALENISSRTTDTEPPFKYAPVEVLAKYAREALAKLG